MVNAVEGELGIPSMLKLEEIRDGNSLISLWNLRPEVQDNKVSFSGIIPGGWRGNVGPLFSFIILAEEEGAGALEVDSARVLLHDGFGTSVPVDLGSVTLNVDSSIALKDLVGEIEDLEPPEVFTIEVSSDPNIYEGDYFIAFSTQDKGSGIDHYEVLETNERLDGFEGDWEEVESPYRLKDQSLRSFIYIRAIDRSGNVRMAELEPERVSTTTTNERAIGVIIIVVTTMALVAYLLRRRKT